MGESERMGEIVERLRQEYPDADGTSLEYETPMQLLVATILSAQSTDETVNRITPDLFETRSSPSDFARMDTEELEEAIYSSGFYHNKAKWIKEASETLVEKFESEIPQNMDSLIELSGVGRKTANIVLSDAFGINEGIPVDTHVKRLTKRLGFTESENRRIIEKGLMDILPRENWYEFSTLLIAHGRDTCAARNPECAACVLNDLCPSAGTFD